MAACCANQSCRSHNIRVTDPGTFRYSFICMKCGTSWEKNSPMLNRTLCIGGLSIMFGPAGFIAGLLGAGGDDMFS